MQWVFSVHEEGCPEAGRIIYDWEKDKFNGVLNHDVPVDYYHFPWEWVEWIKNTGSYNLDDYQCRKYINSRIIPASRHNIGEILKELGLTYYHECFMMRYIPKSTRDDYLTEFISGEDL